MKRTLFLTMALLWHCGLFAINTYYASQDSITNHIPTGRYNGYPVYIVKTNEMLWFYAMPDASVFVDGVKNSSNSDCRRFDTNKLKIGHMTRCEIVRYIGSTDKWIFVCYLIINTPSQSTCANTPKMIGLWNGKSSISRWERSYDGGGMWTNIACNSVEYTDDSPEKGIAKYRILYDDETYSDIVTISYVDAVPSTIQALPATSTKTVEESVTLTADVEDDNYLYQWMKDGKNISGATNSTYTIASIKSADAGNYTCSVSNGCNEVITTTADLSVNKCAQVIDFPEIPVQTYSPDLTYSLPEKTNKGLTITYQSMNTSVATVSGNILTIIAPGTAIISATQVGNNDYLEAAQVSRTLTVNKRTQTIVFDELPVMTYEDLPFTLPQKTDEGLTISYTSSNTSVATVSGNTVTILKPGATDIIASQEGDATHYSAAEVSQTLVVKKAVQEISFGALDAKTYGDAPFTLNEVSNKNLTITYSSSDASIASVSGNTITINKPGTVTITATQAGNAYYLAAEAVSQSLTINKANQAINFPALESRAFDSGDFELPKSTDKGLDIVYASNNQAVSTISGNVVHIVGAGTTVITATQAGNDYYNAAPVASQSLTITKAIQTIDFPELPTCVYGQAPITLNASANSGQEIEYESSDYSVATINGKELTIVGAGQCYITASVYGNKNYYTATPVERTLVVNKAQPTIIFAPLTDEYTYGDDPIVLVASGSTGSVSFTSSDPSKLMIVGTSAIIQGAGQFTVTASVAEDANHLEGSASQLVTIQKANLTATANNASREYGENNPEFSYTLKGFVNGDTKSDISATIQASSAATNASDAGTYEIVVTATLDDNYNIVCKKGVLTVTKAPLTVSTEEASREYGDDNPDYVFTYSGFKNDDNSTALTTLPQAYTTAKKTSTVGTYPVYVSGAVANNYSISYTQGSLVIGKAPLTITAVDMTRTRLEDNPQFQLSISGFKLGQSADDLDKLPTIQCEADKNSPAGTYPIVLLNDGYATNYEYILINGTLTVEKIKYTINVQSNDGTMGTVTGSGIYDEDDVITISAIPNSDYYFISWNDGSVEQTRSVVVSQNASYTAYFAKSDISNAVDETETVIRPSKVIINGQLLILREGKTYNVQGIEVR